MYSDAGVRTEAARGMFAEAVDLVVQIGWRNDRRVGAGRLGGRRPGAAAK